MHRPHDFLVVLKLFELEFLIWMLVLSNFKTRLHRSSFHAPLICVTTSKVDLRENGPGGGMRGGLGVVNPLQNILLDIF